MKQAVMLLIAYVAIAVIIAAKPEQPDLDNGERYKHIKFIAEHIKSVNPKVDNTHIAMSIYDESKKAGIDPLFTTAIIEKESTYRVNCLGAAHERGLMQIHPCHRHSFDWSRINEVDYNIRCGLTLFNGYLSRARGNLRVASGYYTGGRSGRYMGLYERLRRRFSETQNN